MLHDCAAVSERCSVDCAQLMLLSQRQLQEINNLIQSHDEESSQLQQVSEIVSSLISKFINSLSLSTRVDEYLARLSLLAEKSTFSARNCCA